MKKINKNLKDYYFPICLILVLSFSRLIPHPPNFTPILAAGIFSGFIFRNFILAGFVIIISTFLADLYLGLFSSMIFVYISLLITVLLGSYIKDFELSEIILCGILGSVSFFIITNFGAWLVHDMYEKNLSGLIESYVLAIPFFRNTLISTLIYLILFKFLFNLIIKKKIKKFII